MPAEEAPAPGGARAWIRTRAPRFAGGLFLLFVASLAIPALTKQWNDRQQELQVKEGLLTDIAQASADAVYGAVEASRLTGAVQRTTKRATIGSWLRDRAEIEPRFDVYFHRSDASDHWYGREGQPNFRDAVLRYLNLACCDSADMRAARLARLQQYLYAAGRKPEPKDAERWMLLGCGPQEPCEVDPSYSATYQWLGNQVLAQRRRLLDQLLDANGESFSSGWGDFVKDLNPVG